MHEFVNMADWGKWIDIVEELTRKTPGRLKPMEFIAETLMWSVYLAIIPIAW